MPANPFDSLGPIDWAAHPALADDAQLDAFLADTFADAQLLVDSIPAPAAPRTGLPAVTGRPRAQTDGAVSYWGGHIPGSLNGTPENSTTTTTTPPDPAARHRQIQSLRSAWKEVRVSNPRHVAVFKHAAGRDGYGGSSWFARRSVHGREARGKDEVVLSFDVFRRGLQKEFGLAPDDGAGGGGCCKVRTMEVARHLEDRRFGPAATGPAGTAAGPAPTPAPTAAQRSRALHVFQLQAQFPRPTQARDFVTMLLTEHATLPASSASSASSPTHRPPRQFMVVSKPCAHPAAPPRPGYVRAEYESVEVVREVPVLAAAGGLGATRKTRSSMELGGGGGEDAAEPAPEMAVEWLMITRNNPGGNVPRFLVDRNTPSSIVHDANRFLDWLVEQA